MRNIRAASVQFQSANGEKETNLEIVRGFIETATNHNVELIAFPECCLTGYWFLRKLSRDQLMDLSEPVFEGPSSVSVKQWSLEWGITIGVGLIERDEHDRLYNTYIVAMPDGTMQRHRKLHTFIHPEMDSGNEYTVFDTPHDCRVGVLTCYDNNHVENARINALRGAEILLSPHQTGGCATKSPHAMGRIDVSLWLNRKQHPSAIEKEFYGDKGRGWLMRWLPARAHDNGLFLIFSNGVGQDDDEVRTGNAMILDPYGRILAETWKAKDDMVIADLDASLQETSTGRRWLKTRRPELYSPLTQPTGIEQDTRTVRFGLKKE